MSSGEKNVDQAPDPRNACIPCSSMDPSFLLSSDAIQARIHSSLSLWTLESNEQLPAFLSRKFTTKDFQSALDCINAMGGIAERESHHPDFHLTNYRNVEVVIYTHKLNGVTEADLALAEMLDQVKVNYSPKWLKEHPQAATNALT